MVLLTAVAPAASSERPAISGLVHQAPQTETGWFSVSSGAEICAFSPSAPDRGRENCWPALGGRATDLAGGSDGFLAAGHAAADGFIDLFLVAGEGDTVTPLPLPPSNGLPRGSARLVADDGRLLGLVWLEGHRQEDLELRAARWLGNSWEAPATIAARVPGGQVAPAVTVLDDGSWMVVWTAFDGSDDETMWSRFDGRWSPPRRLHEDNPYPDTTPTIVAVDGGAIVAWSAFDGADYRIRLARFDGRAWIDVDHRSGKGGVDPLLQHDHRGARLSYSTVVPDRWHAVELDQRGSERRRASTAQRSASRPAIEWREEGVHFVWFDGTTPPATAGWGDAR